MGTTGTSGQDAGLIAGQLTDTFMIQPDIVLALPSVSLNPYTPPFIQVH
jgi:hypothetical protein